MGKIVDVLESERKYKLQSFNKDSLWEREFIIYQWYDKDDAERKTKVIIDLKSFSAKWVRVTKHRLSNCESKKEVEYLSQSDVDIDGLVGQCFVCKRRSLRGKISVDYFVRSNDTCKYLLENEGDLASLQKISDELGVYLEDVTDDIAYRNTNMTTQFTFEDKEQMLFLLNILVWCGNDQYSSILSKDLYLVNRGG